MNSVTLVGDGWSGEKCTEWTVQGPTEGELQRAVERLDGKLNTIVVVRNSTGSHLAIGGGPTEFVVYATYDDLDFFNLLGDANATGVVLLNAGGQVGDYPAAQIVDRELALRQLRNSRALGDCSKRPTG